MIIMEGDAKFPISGRCKWGVVIWEDFPECVTVILYSRRLGREEHEWEYMIFNTEWEWERMKSGIAVLDLNITQMRSLILEEELNRGW